MNKIKKYIIIFILIIVILITLICLLRFKQGREKEIINIDGDPGKTVEINNKIENVDDFSTFKTVEQCIQQYYSILNNKSSIFYGKDENGTETKILSDAEIKQMRLDLLSDEYKEENNINLNNIDRYVKTSEEERIVLTLEMKQLRNTKVNKYIAKGIILSLDNEFIEDFYIIVVLDFYNETFAIEPILNDYNNIDEIKIENDNKSIEINNNNKYSEKAYSYEEISKYYFSVFKKLALVKPEILYNNYMSSEYKNQRFGSLQEFEKYINQNKQELSKVVVKEYLVNNYEDYTEYVVKDQYENLYIFNKYNNQKLNIMLDTYTIIADKFKEKYIQVEDAERVQMNIDKFFQMINRHDYKTSYKCLSEGFKNNYFKTEGDFSDYMKNNFFIYNKISFKNYEKKGSGLYIVNIELTDLLGESSDVKNINIIMQLNDNLDFKMSFNI